MTITADGEVSTASALLERDEARGRLSGAVSAARAGRGSLMVVVGRPGEGKSALLDEACAIGEQNGLRPLRGWGSSLERGFAFGGARQLLGSVAAELTSDERAAIFSGAARLAAGVLDLEDRARPLDPHAASNGLYWLLAALARRGPLLLALDDAHWSDEASLAWLAGCLRRLRSMPVLVVVATRPPSFNGSGDALATLVSTPDVPLLEVGPLSRGSIAALVERELGGGADGAFLAACETATAGNPLAITELLRDLRRQGTAPHGRSIESLGERAPDTIDRHVQGRLDLLGPAAIDLARALAVLGDRAERQHVASLAGLDPEAAARAIEDLALAGILARGDVLRFEHPLVHAAVRDAISAPRRALLHARAAAMLADIGADRESIATHLLSAEPAGDPAHVDALRAAASAALRRGSPDSALAYLERALSEPPAAELRGAVLGELGVAAWMALGSQALGRVEAARELAADVRERARLDLMLAQLYYFGGQRERLFTVLDRALAELGSAHPGVPAASHRRRV
jgi:tetratricopeptide (TPR) repeat protein